METNSTSAVASIFGSTQAASKADAASEKASTDFQSFLNLLTAQLKNQDPLAPLDSTQFVEQLASFSAVEQQIETNRLLENLASSSAESGLQNATQWIGKQIDAPAEKIGFFGEPVPMVLDISDKGQAGEIIIRNEGGVVVVQEELSQGQRSYTFSGVDDKGDPMATGEYEVLVNYFDEEGESVDSKPPVISEIVSEARLNDGALSLVLRSGAVVDPETIRAVRNVEEPSNTDEDVTQSETENTDEVTAATEAVQEEVATTL